MQESLPVQIGQMVGGYRLDRVLGQGSAGSVYLGTHTLLGRRSAIKVLSRRMSRQPEVVRRFFHEARIVNDIQHANIVDIIDFVHGGDPAVLAYVMEYIDGPSVAEVLVQRRMTQIQVANVCVQLSSALEAAHAIGVVHRDLKPDNVLLLESPESDLSLIPSVKILDFGIAKIDHGDEGEEDNTLSMPTEAGVLMGTPRYMAPEQIGNEAISAKTDVYALTELFYEMLTGQPVFVGSNMAVFQAKLSGQELPLVFPSDIPQVDYLTEMIRAGLAREPAERLDLKDFNQCLSKWLQADSTQTLAYRSTPAPSESGELTEAGATLMASSRPGLNSGEFESTEQNLTRHNTFAGFAQKADRPGVFVTILALALSALGLLYFFAPSAPKVGDEPEPTAKHRVSEQATVVSTVSDKLEKTEIDSSAEKGNSDTKSPNSADSADSKLNARIPGVGVDKKRSKNRRRTRRGKSKRREKRLNQGRNEDDPMKSTELPQW